ncbi:MAG TPA: glycosyltransferase 87 family protein [Polyangia bacterium]
MSYFVAGILRIILLEASAALLVIARIVRPDDARAQRRLDLAFKLIAVLALFSWTNYGALRGGGNLVHRWEQYHFFFGSKYLPEIGYFNLYKATILADRESAKTIGFVRTTRDLTTFDEIPVERALADAAAVRAAFSDARWAAFKRDWSTIAQGGANWAQVMDDHGNSGSPAWAIFAAPIARVCGIGPVGQRLMGLVDPLLMIALFVLFFATFGTRPTSVALVIFSMVPFSFDYLAGSLLRWDWLFALGLCLVMWTRARPVAAGALLGYAIASKLFPLFFGVGFAFWAAWELARTKRIDPRVPRFVAGAVAAVALSVAVSSAMFGPRVWRGYKERIAVAQHEHFYANQYSFKTVFLQAAFSTPREFATNWMLPSEVKAARPDVDVKPWRFAFFFLQLALTALVALGLRRAEPVEAIAIGPLLVYVWLVVNAYYWNMLMLPALAWSARKANDRLLPLLGLHAILIWFYVYQHLGHGNAEGYFVGLLLLVLLVAWSVLSMGPWRASASRRT